jgi:hypothetical protein
MAARSRVFVLAALAACAGEWHSTPAEQPLSRRELSSYDVTVAYVESDDAALAQSLSKAMIADGFRVVGHKPYHEQLQVTLTTERSQSGPVAIATLRSDGFFVDEARAPERGGEATAERLARTLATSQEMADFVRNSGLPQQTKASPQ